MAAVLLVSIGGCKEADGVRRYRRSGSVTFHGQLVEKGEIVFIPDRSRGGSGPGSTVTFERGTFKTRDGQGVVSGPHIVQITGFDGHNDSADGGQITHPWGKLLFSEYRERINFPARASEHQIDVVP